MRLNTLQQERMTKDIMSVQELTQYIGIGRSKIYSLIRKKKIPASKIGRQYRFSKELIDFWMKENVITREEPHPALFARPGSADEGEAAKP